jgi:hypothetical protein
MYAGVGSCCGAVLWQISESYMRLAIGNVQLGVRLERTGWLWIPT